MRVKTAITRFDRQLAANGRSGHTRVAYRRDLRALAGWLGGNPDVRRIAPDDLARFLTSDAVQLSPSGRPRAAISVNRTKSALRSFFAFCVESGFIRENPARLIRSSPTAVKSPTTLTEGEILRLREVAGSNGGPLASRDRLILELLLGTGIRLGSLVALNGGDADLCTGTLRIRLKGGTEGRVFLNPRLRRMMWSLLQGNRPTGQLWPRHAAFSGQHRSTVGRQANPAAIRRIVPGSRNRSPSLNSFPPPHLRHPPLRENRRPAPGPAGARPPADHDDGGLCEGE